eukprot:COSAG02_NODE_5865_length_3977_cov_46.845281_1_plen_90_part_10
MATARPSFDHAANAARWLSWSSATLRIRPRVYVYESTCDYRLIWIYFQHYDSTKGCVKTYDPASASAFSEPIGRNANRNVVDKYTGVDAC